jgi:hypothetical protein
MAMAGRPGASATRWPRRDAGSRSAIENRDVADADGLAALAPLTQGVPGARAAMERGVTWLLRRAAGSRGRERRPRPKAILQAGKSLITRMR